MATETKTEKIARAMRSAKSAEQAGCDASYAFVPSETDELECERRADAAMAAAALWRNAAAIMRDAEATDDPEGTLCL